MPEILAAIIGALAMVIVAGVPLGYFIVKRLSQHVAQDRLLGDAQLDAMRGHAAQVAAIQVELNGKAEALLAVAREVLREMRKGRR